MGFIQVRINEGGKVFMKEKERSKVDKEEDAIGKEFCDAINADKKLQVFFAEKISVILKTFAKEIIISYTVKDKVKASAVMQRAGEAVKGLTTFMHTKVMMKKKEVKP